MWLAARTSRRRSDEAAAPMLIRLRLDPRLLEEGVHLELRRRPAGGDASLFDEYHRQADSLYQLAPEQRDGEFAALHRRLFRGVGFEARITEAISAQQSALVELESLTCLRTLRPEDEGADLVVPVAPATGRAAVVKIRAARFLALDDLGRFLDHELVHVGDLLSAAFGHDAGSLTAISPHRRRLVQERYRALWAASVDGRIDRQGRPPLVPQAGHRAP